MLNTFNKKLWAASPEAVTSMLWDYRGIDTLFETSVFFLAIIGSMTVFRLKSGLKSEPIKGEGLSVIVKVCVKVVFAFITLFAISLALHGHLTPGGGFQAGSAFSIAPLLAISAFSGYFLYKHGFKKDSMLSMRTIGLLAIGILVLVPSTLGLGFLMQNQPKPLAPFLSFPIGSVSFWTSGSLLLYNIAELFAIAAGFTLLYILLTFPEKSYEDDLKEAK